MERNITIYMFDSTKAASNLYKDLQHRIYHTSTFKNYIEDQEKQVENNNINFNSLLECVGNDINMMHPNDLYEITHFFKSQIHPLFPNDSVEAREEYFKTLYDYLGITKLYELTTTNACKAYGYLYEAYIDSFPVTGIQGKDLSINIRTEDFLHFNNFLILVTKKIIDSQLYDYPDELTEEEESIIETVQSENLQNELMSEVIEEEMKFLTKVFYPDNRQDFIQAVYHVHTFLKQAIKMKLIIDVQKNPRIIVVDIY
ncbi:hypothetical protein [Chryseobacterium jejuense]|uniref:Uncharacterized protein n=1 Tax=Chryseobacterium jejuense TaxID=445960 RepID=A0A2X2WYT3_CHRJE|nr:hypothetical protein [Chryseobacterium jejuense]SDJ37664.1 hypothetical protein SAMN05421542_3357 [Chryseobacterium jejuense]SQB45858.1 Uncharacterised protein [Chryseobacterium jejuense]